MNALEGKPEAMVITKPDRKTKQGKKQAQRIWYQSTVWSYQEGKRQQKCETGDSGKVQHQVESKYTEVLLTWRDALLEIR